MNPSSLVKPPKVPKPPSAKGMIKKGLSAYGTTILYTLGIAILFIGVIFLFGGHQYSILSYIYVQLLMFIIGIIHCTFMTRWIPWITDRISFSAVSYSLFLAVLGVGLIYLSLRTDRLPDLPQPYAWSLLLFLLPPIWYTAFYFLAKVPPKVWKPWVYPYGKEIPVVEVINPIKVNFYVAKREQDDEYSEIALNVPINYKLGDFMHYFIHRYNYDKNPQSPIYISPDNANTSLYEWVFRRQPGSNKNRNVLDPVKSFQDLQIGENDMIIVERYQTQKFVIATHDDSSDLIRIEHEEDKIAKEDHDE